MIDGVLIWVSFLFSLVSLLAMVGLFVQNIFVMKGVTGTFQENEEMQDNLAHEIEEMKKAVVVVNRVHESANLRVDQIEARLHSLEFKYAAVTGKKNA